jgi:hypothetical protein
MTEEELEQLLANSSMQGSSSPGWGAAAGYVENRLLKEFNDRRNKMRSERKDPMYPWDAEITTIEERYNSPEGWPFKTDLELLGLWIQKNPDTAEKILETGIGSAVGTPAYTTYKILEWLALNAPGYLKKWGFDPIPIEELGGRKEKDEAGGPDPLGPAPEIPEYDPLEKEEFERGPPSWLVRDDYITDLDAWNDEKPVFDYPDELKPPFLLTGLRDTDPRVIRYNELMPPYRSAVEAFSKEEQNWFDKAPDANLYDMATYLGESVSPRIKAESLRDAGYSPGPDFGWEGDPSAANKEFEEFRKQQEFAERSHREDYDAMVADMVETERLRQEEYAAERQRYTDKYNENPDFYDNLFSGQEGGLFTISDKEWSENLDRHPPLINIDHPFFDLPIEDRGEVFGGMPISFPDQSIPQESTIINQTKPGAYLYPGMLN